MKILFTGGGTAGHILPIIAIVREIKKFYSQENVQFIYLGPKDDWGKDLLPKEGIKTKWILSGKIRRYFTMKTFFQNLIDILFKIPIGFFQSLFYILFLSPDIIFSKGGYGSFPVVLSGWLLFTPVFLHESDVVPGLVNRLTGKLATRIFVSFSPEKIKYLPRKKMVLTGNPVRGEILIGSRERAINTFKLMGDKPIILILGGSQGSQRINDLVLLILPEILKDFEIIHQTGGKNYREVADETDVIIPENLKIYYHPIHFLKEELNDAYAASDLIISRAGAGSIFEIAAVGKPSILIPLSGSAQDHQVQNAYAFAENNTRAIVIEEENLTPHFFLERVKHLFSQPERLKEMSTKAKEFSKPAAAQTIAKYLIKYLNP